MLEVVTVDTDSIDDVIPAYTRMADVTLVVMLIVAIVATSLCDVT